jgi:predicted ATPase
VLFFCPYQSGSCHGPGRQTLPAFDLARSESPDRLRRLSLHHPGDREDAGRRAASGRHILRRRKRRGQVDAARSACLRRGTAGARGRTPDAPSSPLHQYLRLVKSSRLPRAAFFLRAENAFSAIGKIDEANAIAPGSRDSLHARSHGEGFIELLLGLTDGGLYFLDEPEAALSPSRQLAALAVIDRLVRNGCQFIIATHSPILLAYPNAKILSFDEGGIHETAYEDTEHYAVTRDFLNHYERRLQQLLDEDES